MKMSRVLLFTLCVAVTITTTLGSPSTAENQGELVDPVDDVDETEEEGPPPRPIRASAASVTAATPRRKRVRGRKNRERASGNVQKRRLQAFRPTRAPLFEASPPDPYIQNGIVGPTGHYGHSHSPPTRDPYYSPSRYERERKRQRIKLASEAPLQPLPQNSFDDTGPTVLSSPGFKQSEKNYAFAYAVGDDAEDFSHKQAKDGPITIGEYRITLPDGRTQVVRYTAGGKHGYKADVTYEAPDQQSLGPAGPSGNHQHHHNQYHEPVQPTHHFSATPASSFNSNRVIKSRPLKNMALHSNEDEVEYSPPASHDEYHFPRPSPKIRLKAGGNILPSPTPTADYLNGIGGSSTPTPRPNSIYDKISPFRGGKYSGSEELAYAHEHSPRAGPSRSPKSKHTLSKLVSTTAATYYDSPSPSPYPHKATVLTPAPTKKYKSPTHYVGTHQSQANHLNEYNVRPQKHIQFLQETPVHHHHQQIRHQHTTPLIAKPVKQQVQHLVPLDHYKNGPVTVSYAPQVHHKPKKSKKSKHGNHGIHNPLGQYLLQAPVTAQTPISYHSTSAGLVQKEPFHYFNSFHPQHHQGFGQISNPSPTPVTSVTHSESPYPNAYPVTAYPTGGTGQSQPRLRLPSPTGSSHFLETPASGERPNRLGVKEALSRLPSRDLPSPKTTIHPYEVGAVDYGKGVAYGNSQQDKGYPEAHYGNFGGGDFPSGLDNLDPSLYNSVTSPSPGTTGFGGHQDIGYYPNDPSNQFDFLNGLGNYDVEQANVREIRQPRPQRVGGRLSRRVNRRPVPDKRRGVPATSAEPSKEEREMKRQTPPSTSSRPPARQQRQRKQSPPPQRPTSTSPRSVRPSRQPPTSSSPPTTSRTRGRRRRMRTQQPEREPPMMHTVESQSRRPRKRSRNSSK